ncbi:DUF3291 domain-containing protein [Actibacterium sp. D379-3]
MLTPDHHLAELNFGTLKYGWDDPRTKGFVEGLDLVNGLAEASDGFIWRLGDDDMDQAQNDAAGVFGGDPNTASTLSVWRDVESLEHFVWNTVHRRFYERKAEWYDVAGNGNFVMWWVPAGHRPTLTEGMARFRHWQAHGNTDHAFGWDHLRAAHLWKTRACSHVAGSA